METVVLYPETVIDVIIADIRGSNTYGIRKNGDVHNKTSGEWSVPTISADQIRKEADIPEVDENIETLEEEIDGQFLQFESVEFHVLSTEGRIEFLNAVDSKFSGEYADIIEELVEDFIKTGEIYRFHGVSASYAAEASSNFTKVLDLVFGEEPDDNLADIRPHVKAWEVETDAGTELVTHFYRGGEEEDVGEIGTPEYLIQTELNHEAYSEEWNDVVKVNCNELDLQLGLDDEQN